MVQGRKRGGKKKRGEGREREKKRGSRKEGQGKRNERAKKEIKGGGAGKEEKSTGKSHIVTASNNIISKSFGVLPRTAREGSLFHHCPGQTATIPVPFRSQLLLAFKPLSH